MGSRTDRLSEADKAFIARQKLFFIASSSNGGEVNLSPRGYDVFRIMGDNEALFLDYVGSGNRTARDIEADGEVTVLFTAFEGNPLNLRLFCKGEMIDRHDAAARVLFDGSSFEGMRRFIKLHIYCVEHSCGMSVPYYEYVGEREALKEFCVNSERDGKLESFITKNKIPADLGKFRG